MINNYQCFCFDFDGTLIDSNHIKRKFFNELLSNHLTDKGLERELQSISIDRFSLFDEIIKHNKLNGQKLNLDIQSLSSELDARVMQAELYPGVLELLNSLHEKRVDCYLLSATPIASLLEVVERKQLTPFFKGIFGKPAVKSKTLIELSQKYKKSIVMLGDGQDDRCAAGLAAVDFIAVGEGRGALSADKIYSIAQITKAYKDV